MSELRITTLIMRDNVLEKRTLLASLAPPVVLLVVANLTLNF